jgi:hypothetical protein
MVRAVPVLGCFAGAGRGDSADARYSLLLVFEQRTPRKRNPL